LAAFIFYKRRDNKAKQTFDLMQKDESGSSGSDDNISQSLSSDE
jgi:hypothetical protein